MSIKTKLIGGASALAIAGGMIAFAAPAGAVVTNMGSCQNLLALGTAKSSTINIATGKNYGITDLDNLDGAIGSKGVGRPTKTDSLGTCTITGGQGAPDSGKPVALITGGSHTIAKWSTKLFSREFDCNTADTSDTSEWSPSGALSITFTDNAANGTPAPKANTLTAQVTVDGFTDPDNDPGTPSDVVGLHGIVTKGALLGADLSGETEFDPTVKDKTQTTNTPYLGYQFDVAGALGCTTPTVGDANIVLFNNGSVGGLSQLLGLPVAGINFSKGTA